MKWATRKGPHVDRTACAWLIARFIDPEPERGLSMVRPGHEVLALSAPLYDGLYEYCKRAGLLGREPA